MTGFATSSHQARTAGLGVSPSEGLCVDEMRLPGVRGGLL